MLRVIVVALALSSVQRAWAHGSNPAATELLVRGEEGATLLRLAPGGLAHRVPDGFRFVCPEAWGGDILAPTAALPAGPALVASDQLFVVEPDGRVSPHPVQSGAGIAVASHRDAVFGLFKHEGKHELRRVTQATNDLVSALAQPFGALVATDSELALLRWLDSTLVLQRMSLTGELRESMTWTVPNAVSHARLRAAGAALYVVVWGRSAPWVTLGRVTERGYEPLREASSDIAGPVALSTGTLVALDGTLALLEGGTTIDTLGDRATCLGANDGQPYACARGDLLRVDRSGFGAPLFELSALREPDYRALPEAARMDCSTRWLDLHDHVVSSATSSAAADAGGPGTLWPDAATPTPSAAAATGCSLGAAGQESSAPCLIVLALYAAMRAWSGRRKEHASG